MTKKEFFEQNRNNLHSIAYISALGGIEIYEIEHGINDCIFCADGAWCGRKTIPSYQHKVKIRYNSKSEPYFELYNQRYYFKDAVRTDFC